MLEHACVASVHGTSLSQSIPSSSSMASTCHDGPRRMLPGVRMAAQQARQQMRDNKADLQRAAKAVDVHRPSQQKRLRTLTDLMQQQEGKEEQLQAAVKEDVAARSDGVDLVTHTVGAGRKAADAKAACRKVASFKNRERLRSARQRLAEQQRLAAARAERTKVNFQVEVEVRSLSGHKVLLGPFGHNDTMTELQEAINEYMHIPVHEQKLVKEGPTGSILLNKGFVGIRGREQAPEGSETEPESDDCNEGASRTRSELLKQGLDTNALCKVLGANASNPTIALTCIRVSHDDFDDDSGTDRRKPQHIKPAAPEDWKRTIHNRCLKRKPWATTQRQRKAKNRKANKQHKGCVSHPPSSRVAAASPAATSLDPSPQPIMPTQSKARPLSKPASSPPTSWTSCLPFCPAPSSSSLSSASSVPWRPSAVGALPATAVHTSRQSSFRSRIPIGGTSATSTGTSSSRRSDIIGAGPR